MKVKWKKKFQIIDDTYTLTKILDEKEAKKGRKKFN